MAAIVAARTTRCCGRIRFFHVRASASAVVSSIALRRAENKVRRPGARIQVELDRPGGRIETGLALRNQRKIFHVQLSLQHAYDLIWTEKVPGGHDPVAKLIFARVPRK